MVQIYGPQAMKAMDSYAISELNIPSLDLMEQAAEQVLPKALAMLSQKPGPTAVVCGAGNNGGDGVALARLLHARGHRVRCFLVGSPEKLTPDTTLMARRLLTQGVPFELVTEEVFSAFSAFLDRCSLIIDALFGVGLNRDLSGLPAQAVEAINHSPAQVLSCDLPSGIHGATGQVLGTAVQADMTVTFTGAKPGQLLSPGVEYTGQLHVADIGIPMEAQKTQSSLGELTDGAFVRSLLPRRARTAHKSDFGRLLLLCGSRGYTGAAALAARGALRSGAGLISLGVPESIYPILAAKLDEPMVFPLPEDKAGRLATAAWEALQEPLARADAVLVGPGLGRSKKLTGLVQQLLETCTVPLVLDADGINALAGHIDMLRGTRAPVVLTPHEGEFARLSDGLSRLSRLEAARELAAQTGAVVVLKGYRTVIAAPDGRLRVNTTGNPGMATGGSGDVLAGMLTALLGQGLSPFDAASAAVWLHGAAGDRAAEALGEYSLTPTDLLETLPQLMK